MRYQKNNNELSLSLKIIGGISAILFGVYPILCNSLKLLSDNRLQKVSNQTTTVLAAGNWNSNLGVFYYLVFLVIGYWLAMKFYEKPTRFLWSIFTVIPIIIGLLGYFIWLDFPHPSPRADLLSEIMMIFMFSTSFPLIVNFVTKSIFQKKYDRKFWMITGGYTAVYLFLLPALIGDIITMLRM